MFPILVEVAWLKRGGGEKSIKHFKKKQDAIKYGRGVSENQGSEFMVHKIDGTIQNPDSHGGNPMPPRDRK